MPIIDADWFFDPRQQLDAFDFVTKHTPTFASDVCELISRHGLPTTAKLVRNETDDPRTCRVMAAAIQHVVSNLLDVERFALVVFVG